MTPDCLPPRSLPLCTQASQGTACPPAGASPLPAFLFSAQPAGLGIPQALLQQRPASSHSPGPSPHVVGLISVSRHRFGTPERGRACGQWAWPFLGPRPGCLRTVLGTGAVRLSARCPECQGWPQRRWPWGLGGPVAVWPHRLGCHSSGWPQRACRWRAGGWEGLGKKCAKPRELSCNPQKRAMVTAGQGLGAWQGRGGVDPALPQVWAGPGAQPDCGSLSLQGMATCTST